MISEFFHLQDSLFFSERNKVVYNIIISELLIIVFHLITLRFTLYPEFLDPTVQNSVQACKMFRPIQEHVIHAKKHVFQG